MCGYLTADSSWLRRVSDADAASENDRKTKTLQASAMAVAEGSGAGRPHSRDRGTREPHPVSVPSRKGPQARRSAAGVVVLYAVWGVANTRVVSSPRGCY